MEAVLQGVPLLTVRLLVCLGNTVSQAECTRILTDVFLFMMEAQDELLEDEDCAPGSSHLRLYANGPIHVFDFV